MHAIATTPGADHGIARTNLAMPLLGIIIGCADLALAAAWWMPHGTSPIRIPQSIAAWVMGPALAHAGGVKSAVLGLAFYCVLTTFMVALYSALSRHYLIMLRHPFVGGGFYGAVMYLAIFEVAVPLWSLAPVRIEPAAWTATCVFAYVFMIGIPCALFARLQLAQE